MTRLFLIACCPSSQINVRVTTMDAELEFAIQPNTTGKQLFDQVRGWKAEHESAAFVPHGNVDYSFISRDLRDSLEESLFVIHY